MKNLLLITLLVLFAYQVQADYDFTFQSGNKHSFTYYGQRETSNIKLFDVEKVWTKELQTVRSTCFRKKPYKVRVCSRSLPRRCHFKTRYKTTPYSCLKTEYVTVRKPDQRFHAHVDFKFKNNDHFAYSSDSLFRIKLDKDSLKVSAKDNNQFDQNIYLAKVKLNKSQRSNVTTIDASYKVNVFNKNKFLSPIGRSLQIHPRLSRSTFLLLSSGTIEYPKTLKLKLRITTPRGVTLFNQKVPSKFLKINPSPGSHKRSQIRVNLEKLLGHLPYYQSLNVTAQLSLNKKGSTILNSGFIPSLKVNQRQKVSTY